MADLALEVRRNAEKQASKKRSPLSVRAARELQAHTQGMYLIKGMVPSRSIVQIVAAPNEGKTAVALDIAMHVATNRPHRGRKTQAGLAVYVALEARHSVENRVIAWCKQNRVDPDGACFYLVDGFLDLRSSASVSALIAEVSRLQELHGSCRLIVIDTQARATPGADENSSVDIGRMLMGCAAIVAAFGDVCLLLVHHMGKDATRGARGHSSQLAAVDCVLEISNRELRVTKSRDGVRDEVFAFDLVGEKIGEDEDGEPVSAVVAVAVDAPSGRRGPPRRLSDGSKNALRALRDVLLREGTVAHPMDAPLGTKAVKLDAWRHAHRERYGGDSADKDSTGAERKAWARALEQLQAAAIVTVAGEWVYAHDRKA
ncbi:MAG: AAA family ATPase [Burkholderiales bacterium]|nr:AAA family ATPase [Burkholderiales bacterium]